MHHVNKFIYVILLVCGLLFFNPTSYAQGFLPSDISGLKLWINGDSVEITTPPFVNKSYDLSASGNHALQTVVGLKPISLASSFLNGHKIIRFDGNDDYIEFNEIQDIRTVFWVVLEDTDAVGGYIPMLGNTYTLDFLGESHLIWGSAYANPFVINGITKINSSQINGTVTNRPNEFSLISLLTTGNVKAASFSKDRGNSNRVWDGDLAELIIYNQPLSASQIDSVEQYLTKKYTHSIELPDNKIVCSLPITIKPNSGYFKNYLWQDGSTADSLKIFTPGKYYVKTQNIFDKFSSDTIYINLDTTTTQVSLQNDTSICFGKNIVINAGSDHLNYTWSNGINTNSITVNTSGLYKVTMIDCKGNISKDSIQVSIIPLPSFDFGNDTIICSNSNFNLDPSFTNSLPLTFNWQDNTHDSILPVSTNGQYFLNVLDNIGCSYSDTVNIQIDTTMNLISLGLDTNLCAGNAISLKVGDQSGLSYVWNDNSTNNSLIINTSGQYSAIITNTNNCVAKDTINVTVLGFAPTASFLNSIACKNNVISFTDDSTPPSGNTISSWFWNYGDGTTLADTSHFQNPNYTYADTGNYNVNLTITTNVGCKQVLIQNVHVAPKPTVNYNNIIACKNDSAVFTNSITTFGYPTTSYLWNFGDPVSGSANTSTLPNLKHLFSQQTIYPVKLIATNSAGCKDSITKNINVRAQVTASFTNTSACSKGSITFQDNSIVPAPNSSNIRNWNFGTSSATGLTVTKTFSLGGIYPITLTVTGSNGCTSSITQSVNVMLPPVAEFTLPSICSKDTATAIDQSIAQNGTITAWTWKLDNIPFSSVQNPTLSPVATTAYSVKLIIINSFNCVDSITKTFNVYPLPAVDFTTSPSTYYYPNSPITFIPTNPTGVLYNWTINSIPYSVQSPTVVITTPGTYTASLFQKNNLGCGNTKSKTINILNPYLDLALLEANATKSSNNYYSVSARLANFGTLAISSFDISYQISDAGSVWETWNGLLNPGEFMTYQFTAKTLAKNTSDGNVACINIESVNTINDHNLSNNKQCVTENSNSIVVSNPYPNPTDGDITLPIILNKDTEYTYELFDALGQIILEETTEKGTAGLNLVSIPTSALRRGCYLLKITINDKTYLKKVLKNIAE